MRRAILSLLSRPQRVPWNLPRQWIRLRLIPPRALMRDREPALLRTQVLPRMLVKDQMLIPTRSPTRGSPSFRNCGFGASLR
mgnify:CR=1 FL=1